MGNAFGKLCSHGKEPDKDEVYKPAVQPVEEGSEAKVLTNQGGTIDKTTDNSQPADSSAKKNGKPADMDNITIDEKAQPKPIQQNKQVQDEPEQKKNGKRKKKKKRYVDSSSDSTSSSSSSDEDSHIEKKYTKKNKDGSITKVYSKSTFSAGTKINIIKGDHITINDKKTIIKNNPPKPKKEPERLFTQMFTEQSARKMQTDLFGHSGPFNVDCGGSFIDVTKYTLVEEVKGRQILDIWTKSVGLIKSPRGTCSCFRVGTRYIMTALHAIKELTKPEYQGVQDYETDWQGYLGSLRQPNIFIDFEYLTNGEHIEENKFIFNIDENNTVPFVDESADTIVLELTSVSGRPLPPPFKTFGLPKFDKKFSLVHHSGGKPKQVEPVDKMVDIDSARTIADVQTLQNSSERFLISKGKDVEIYRCECPPYDVLRSRDRLLFHCVGGKGASGCPGIQVLSDGSVVVVTMLLHGYPDWYYSDECRDIAGEWDKSYTIEQGVNFATIGSQMRRENVELFHNIFDVRPSRTVQPVQPEN